MFRQSHSSCFLSGMEPNRFISQTESESQSSRAISGGLTKQPRSCSLCAEANCFILKDIVQTRWPTSSVPWVNLIVCFPTSQTRKGITERVTSSPTTKGCWSLHIFTRKVYRTEGLPFFFPAVHCPPCRSSSAPQPSCYAATSWLVKTRLFDPISL